MGRIDNLTADELKKFLKAGERNIGVTLSIDSNPTGINSIKADMSSSKAYTLQGTVAQPGYKGIVIRNGKKILGGF